MNYFLFKENIIYIQFDSTSDKDSIKFINNNNKEYDIPKALQKQYNRFQNIEKIQYYLRNNILDKAKNGSLYFYLLNKISLDKNEIKMIFHSILQSVQKLQKKNTYDLNIRPDNIFFDKECNPILVNMNYNKNIQGEQSNDFNLKKILLQLIIYSTQFEEDLSGNSLYNKLKKLDYGDLFDLLYKKEQKQFFEFKEFINNMKNQNYDGNQIDNTINDIWVKSNYNLDVMPIKKNLIKKFDDKQKSFFEVKLLL